MTHSQQKHAIDFRGYHLTSVGEFVFLGGVAMSILVAPQGMKVDDGLSIFSVLPASFWPFTVGLLVGALLVAYGAFRLPRLPALRGTRELLFVVAVLMCGVAFTPFNLSPLIGSIHKFIGISVYVIQFTLASWLMVTSAPRLIDWPLFILLALSALGASFSLDGGIGYSFQGQLVFQITFSFLILRALSRILSGRVANPHVHHRLM